MARPERNRPGVTASGIVLRTTPYRDNDLIVGLLVEDYGHISAIARSARTSKKRFPGGIDIFDCAKFELSPPTHSSTLYTLSALRDRTPLINLRRTLSRFQNSCSLLEITANLCPEGDKDAAALLPPLKEALSAIDTSGDEQEELIGWINCILRQLELSGFSARAHRAFFSRNELMFLQLTQEDPKNYSQYNQEFLRSMKATLTSYLEQEIFGRTLRSSR